MKKEDICLLLTGCITPMKEVYALQVKDSDIRKQQYLEALKFYVEKTAIKKIVYCDNSNAEEIKEIAEFALQNKKMFEWIAFQGNMQKTIENGKGYGEGEILKYACENSKLMRTCRYFVKVTGRLKITNLNSILSMIGGQNNYFNLYINREGKYFADTRFFIVKTEDFQRYLISEYENVNDRRGKMLEICFAKKITDSGMLYKKFPTYIGYEGISGSTGLGYALSAKEKTQLFVNILKQTLFYRNEIYASMETYQKGIVYNDSMWNERFSELSHKNIAIYGAGVLGQRLYKLCIKHCNVVIWVDKDYKKIKKRCGKKIFDPEKIKSFQVDYIIVAICKPDIFQQVKGSLQKHSIKAEIIWFNGTL